MTAYYDEFDYQSYWIGREYEDRAEKIAIQKFLKEIPQRNSIVDVGAGFGRLTPVYAPLFKKCLLVDPSKELLAQAKRNPGGFGYYKRLEFQVGSIEKLPIKTRTFDAALLVRVIHHLDESAKALVEVFRILQPGGFLILEFANKIHFRAKIKAYFRGDSSFVGSLLPREQRKLASIKAGKIIFVNHHPKKIQKELEKTGFEIIEVLSVSNFRLSFFKKLLPSPLLLFLENLLQKPLAKIYFGPSIFILAQKK